MKKIIPALLSLAIAGCNGAGFSLPDASQNLPTNIYFNNKVDVMMMIDNSSSMLPKQQQLAAQIPAMVAALDAQSLDYRIVVVTSDVRTGGNGGRYVGSPSILYKGQPGLASALQSRILQGDTGSDLESGLQSIRLAIENDLSDGVSAFIRDDAMLAILVLSDENDFSMSSVGSYISFLESVKRPFASGNRSWLLNYIGILPNDSMCTTAGLFREPGARYLEVVDYTGGVQESICNTNFSNVVSNVRTRINQFLSDFYFDREPKPETIAVVRNGVPVPESATNGWRLLRDARNGKFYLRFSGSYVPTPTDRVQVTYSPVSAT